jgi:phage shock protein E
VQGGARLVDVRTPDEYAEKHLESAENVPLDRLFEQDMGPKDRAIVVYCMKGGRARLAANSLHDRGYAKVYRLGRMDHWEE